MNRTIVLKSLMPFLLFTFSLQLFAEGSHVSGDILTYEEYQSLVLEKEGLVLSFPKDKLHTMYDNNDSIYHKNIFFGNQDESGTWSVMTVPFSYNLTNNSCIFFSLSMKYKPRTDAGIPTPDYEKMTKKTFVPCFRECLLNNCALPATHYYNYKKPKQDKIKAAIGKYESFLNNPKILKCTNSRWISVTKFPNFKRVGAMTPWLVSSDFNISIHILYDKCYGIEFWNNGRRFEFLLFVADGEYDDIEPYIKKISHYIRFE